MAVIPPPHFFRPPTSISSPPRKLRLLCSASEPEKLRTAFAAGGVGGHHIYPAVRIAVEVRALNPDAAAPDAGYEFASISDAIKSLRKLEEFYPQVILNRILTSFVESLFVAYDSIVEYFPVPEKKRKEKCVVSGNSVRQFMRKKFLSREARYSLDLIADDEFASIADAIKSWMKLDSIVDYFPVAKCVVSGNSVRPLLSKRREATKARYSSDLEPEKIRIVFAAGGVGGHIYPAVAIADEVRALNPNVEILFIGTESGIESKAVPAAGYEFASISDTASATLARPVLSLKNIGLPLHLIRSTLKSWKKLEEFDPQVVVGTGGYVSLPTCLAAVLRRVKVVIQEQSSVPGIANRILSVFAESVFVAYDSIVEYFPAAEKRKCVVSGNPVRPLLRKPVPREAAIGRYFPDLDTTSLGSEMKVLLILGGSLGANAINIALERIYRDMLIDHPDWFIIWETGIDTYDEMESLIISHPRLVLRAFLHNMHMAYTAADVVVSRAGAMTCSELMATGKPAILIPSPNEEEGHQFSNASLMADLAGSRMIIEDELDSTTLRLVIEETMGSEYVMSVMSERALQAAKPKAGAEIAEYILSLANSSDKLESNASVTVFVSPGGSRYYIPVCGEDLKPYIGQSFSSLDAAALFYKRYAEHCGFGVRKGTITKSSDGTNVSLRRYLLCSRQGVKSSSSSGSDLKRRRITNRCLCKAQIIFKYVGHKGYVVFKFHESHTHPMVTGLQKQFLRSNRKVTPFHQDFIINCLKSNIGTSKAYKLYKNSVGEYSHVGATIVDFKNFSRDLNAYMLGYDGQMVIDGLFRKKEMCEAFHFSYYTDDQNRIVRLFWADPIARKSFSFFGDVVSADATYKTNRYNMVFVPFTGVDNNNSSITFAFGLLLNEDIDSYVWLFENFKKSMGHEPYIILTDQDLSVKAAVESVFTTAVHRFCMWHIMFKVSTKVKVDKSEVEDFRKRFNYIIWSNELNKEEFEDSWKVIIHDFHLEDNAWLQSMFELRQYWIPAFFRDVQMGGLLRTTSRSESQNHFFSNFIGASSTLVLFMVQFGNAVDSQRYNQNKLDLDSSTSVPMLKTALPIEKQCAFVFTLNVFHDIQKEICEAAFDCGFSNFEINGDVHHIHVTSRSGKVHIVKHFKSSSDFLCSCNKFMNEGLPCSHLFFVFRSIHMDELPEKFIIPRWTKKSTLKPTFKIDDSVYTQGSLLDERKALSNELFSEMHEFVNIIEDDVDAMRNLLRVLKQEKEVYLQNRQGSSSVTQPVSRIQNFLGPLPEEIEVHPPPQSKNKGRPKQKRLKGIAETIRNQAAKEKRSCALCNKPGHNIRTCPEDKQEKKK